MQCTVCNEANDEGADYCEACGTPLNEAAKHTATDAQASGQPAKAVDPTIECPCCHAGPGCIDDQGHCTNCGTKRKAAPRDHFFQALSASVAGVSDIGMKYRENQDYMALGEKGGVLALVVCDGVSNSQNPMIGSKAASELARDLLLAGSARSDLDVLFNEAVVASQEAICKVSYDKNNVDKEGKPVLPAQATFVAALVQGRRVTIGWVGDSRAYWISDAACQQLTSDHSWFNWAIAEGGFSRADAEADKRAHAITRSLGAAEDGTNPGIDPPDIRTLNVTRSGSGNFAGTLVVCSDGLWNYLKDEEHLRSLVSKWSQGGQVDALTVARKLVTFAREAGGHDNITAVVAYLQ